jgi:CBS domain-containing protein
MTRRHSRHVPVLDGSGHLVGLVSIGDIVRMRLEEAESGEMRAYVMQESSHAPMPPHRSSPDLLSAGARTVGK